MTNEFITIVVPDFIYFQLTDIEPVAEALDKIPDGTVGFYPRSAVDLEVSG